MAMYIVDDGNAPIEIEADSAQEAAQEYVDGGDWGDIDSTTYIEVWAEEIGAGPKPECVYCDKTATCQDAYERPACDEHGVEGTPEPDNENGEREWITITIEVEEPECEYEKEEGHLWQSPFSVVGGIKENPGVWAHGGGVIIKEVCPWCGMYKITDTWAQDMSSGNQGLTSVEYKKADEKSMFWLENCCVYEDFE